MLPSDTTVVDPSSPTSEATAFRPAGFRKAFKNKLAEAKGIERKPSRTERDAQLRTLAREHARDPEAAVRPGADPPGREITGKVLGYTFGREEALFQRTGGGLVQLEMRGRAELPAGPQIDIDPKASGLSAKGVER